MRRCFGHIAKTERIVYVTEDITAPGSVKEGLVTWIEAARNGYTQDNGSIIKTVANLADSDNSFARAKTSDIKYLKDAKYAVNFHPVIEFNNNYFKNSNIQLNNIGAEVYSIVGTFDSIDGTSNAYDNKQGIFGPGADSPASGLDFYADVKNKEIILKEYGANSNLVTIPLANGPLILSALRSQSGASAIGVDGNYTFGATDTSAFASTGYYIGATHDESVMLGTMPELMVYDRELSAEEKAKVNSYLAIKYGLTLNNGESDYVDGSGNIVWAKDDTYKYNIFGIGKDSAAGLDQKISHSVKGGVLTIATSNDFETLNENPQRAQLQDGSFEMLANNGGELSWGVNEAIEDKLVLNRVWKVKESGTVGKNYIAANDNSATGATLPSENEKVYMLVSNSEDFSDAATYEMEQVGNQWVLANGADLEDGQFITFATNTPKLPGGVNKEPSLWLKADGKIVKDDDNKVSRWIASAGVDVNQSTPALQPEMVANAINFNPAIKTDDQDDFLANADNNLTAKDIFVVTKVLGANENCDGVFSEYDKDLKDIRLCSNSGASWFVPNGNDADFSKDGKAWFDGKEVTSNPAHNNVPSILQVESKDLTTYEGFTV